MGEWITGPDVIIGSVGRGGAWQRKPAFDQAKFRAHDQCHPAATILECGSHDPIPQFSDRSQKSSFACGLCQFFSVDSRFNVSSECVANSFCGLLASSVLTLISHFIKGEQAAEKGDGSLQISWLVHGKMLWNGSALNGISTGPMRRKTSVHTSGLIETNQPS